MENQPNTPDIIEEDVNSKILAIIEDLKKQGVEDEQILTSLQEMVSAGTLSQEEYDVAVQMLQKQEETEAEEMFGIKFQ